MNFGDPECVGLRGGPGVSVMFWGCINFAEIGILTEISDTMDTTKYIETLDNNLWPVIAKDLPKGGYIFQDDNIPCYKSQRALTWKRQNGINCLNWPSQSPDVNIIENVWMTFKIQLQKSEADIRNRDTLIREVMQIWVSLTPVYIQSLYASIPRTLKRV